ncbi:unnamed protein product [Prunus armeniaca]
MSDLAASVAEISKPLVLVLNPNLRVVNPGQLETSKKWQVQRDSTNLDPMWNDVHLNFLDGKIWRPSFHRETTFHNRPGSIVNNLAVHFFIYNCYGEKFLGNHSTNKLRPFFKIGYSQRLLQVLTEFVKRGSGPFTPLATSFDLAHCWCEVTFWIDYGLLKRFGVR